jgi:pyruvate dehydrogenase E1 component
MLKDKIIGKNVSCRSWWMKSRTFGMEGLFRQIGIWNQDGQKYVPQDADQLMFYKKERRSDARRMASMKPVPCRLDRCRHIVFACTSVQMMPVYIYYSMFGMQRTMDLVWAAGDISGARLPHRRHGRSHHARGRRAAT